MAGRGKILVIRGGAIGDFILTLPVFAALRARFPETHLEVLGYPNVTAIAASAKLVDGRASIESRALARFFARNAELDEQFSAYFAQFSHIFSYLYDPDGFFEQNVKKCSAAQFIKGTHRPEENSKVHATEVLLRPLETLAIFDADPQARLQMAPPAIPLASGGIALHPGSGSEKKNWPIEAWIEFAVLLHEATKESFLIVGGEAEGGKLDRIAGALNSERVQVLRGKPLVEVAQQLGQCRAFVGHDSGISHLAAAVGLPGLVLWGNTNPDVWRPRSAKINLLEAGSALQRLKPRIVFESFRASTGV